MGILTKILLSPFMGPVWGAQWSLEKVERAVKEELSDDTAVKNEFMQLQLELESGEIDDDEYLVREKEIMARLRAVREWREEFGMSISGGPVRVAREEGDE